MKKETKPTRCLTCGRVCGDDLCQTCYDRILAQALANPPDNTGEQRWRRKGTEG